MLTSIRPILYYSRRGTISFCSYADTSLNILHMNPLNHLHDDNFIHEFRMAENPYQKFVLVHVVDLFCDCGGTFESLSNRNEYFVDFKLRSGCQESLKIV